MTTQTITLPESTISTEFLRLVRFRDFERWDVKRFFQKNELHSTFPTVELSEILYDDREEIEKTEVLEKEMLIIKKINFGGELFLRDFDDVKTYKGKLFRIRPNQIIFSKINARHGCIYFHRKDSEFAVSSEYPSLSIRTDRVLGDYLQLVLRSEYVKMILKGDAKGHSKARVTSENLLAIQIPLPNLETQAQIVKSYHDRINEAVSLSASAETKEKEIEAYLVDALGITIRENTTNKGFEKIRFKDLEDWSPDSIFGEYRIQSEKFEIISFSKKQEYYLDAFRGKSPQYKDETGYFVLNQKCNRWDGIELEHAKTVDDEWLLKVNKNLLTKKGDLIINSTGEGTLGRCSLIREGFEGLLCDSHMLLLRVNPQKVDASFLVKQFNAGFFQKQIDAIKSARATKQTELGVDNLLNLSFVIPPLVVQFEIIEHIETMKVEMSEAKKRAEKLRESSKREFEAELFGIS